MSSLLAFDSKLELLFKQLGSEAEFDERWDAYVGMVDGKVVNMDDIGGKLNTRRMSIGGLVGTCDLWWCSGVFKRCMILYSHVLPLHAHVLSTFMNEFVAARGPVKTEQLQSLFKDITSVCKTVTGMQHVVRGCTFSLHSLSGFTDINRFVGYNAEMPEESVGVQRARDWLVEPKSKPLDFKVRFISGVKKALRNGGTKWSPHHVVAPTWNNADEYLPAIMTSGAVDSKFDRLYYMEDGEVVKTDKTKAAAFGAFRPGQFAEILKSVSVRPGSRIRVFVKPDELGKVRFLAIDSTESYLVMSLWLHTVMEVLRGHVASPLFHSLEAEMKVQEQLMSEWLRSGGVALPLDQAAFDVNQSKWQVEGALKVVQEFVLPHVDQDGLFTTLYETMMAIFENTNIEIYDKVIGKYGNGIASGWAITAFIDTIVNLGESYALTENMLDITGQGDDTSLIVSSLESAYKTVANFQANNLEIHPLKQSYGTLQSEGANTTQRNAEYRGPFQEVVRYGEDESGGRPITEFLRKVQSVGGDVYTRWQYQTDVPTKPLTQTLYMTKEAYMSTEWRWRAQRIACVGQPSGAWKEQDAHVIIVESGTDVQTVPIVSPHIVATHTSGQLVDWGLELPAVNIAAMHDRAPSQKVVYGYASRMLPKLLLRTPGAAEPKEYELRLESAVANWCKLLARGVYPDAAIWLMINDIFGLSKIDKRVLCAWLTTPACMGGYGLVPMGQNWVQLMHAKVRARYPILGYKGLFKMAKQRLRLKGVDDAELVLSRVRGVPLEPFGEEWELITKSRSMTVVLRRPEMAKVKLAMQRAPLGAVLAADTPAALLLLQGELAAIKDPAQAYEFILSHSAEQDKAWSTRAWSVLGGKLFLEWANGDLDMFKSPKFFQYADSWVGIKFQRLAERAFAHCLLTRHRVSRIDLEATSLAVVGLVEEEISMAEVIWRD